MVNCVFGSFIEFMMIAVVKTRIQILKIKNIKIVFVAKICSVLWYFNIKHKFIMYIYMCIHTIVTTS